MLAASDHVRLSKNIIPSSSSLSSNKRSSSIEEKAPEIAEQQQQQELANNGRKRTITLTSITDTIHSHTSSTSGYEASTSSTAPLKQNAISPGVHHSNRYSQPSSSTLASFTEGTTRIAATLGGATGEGKTSRSMNELESDQQEESIKGFTRLRTDSVSSTTVAARSNAEDITLDSRIDNNNNNNNTSSQRRRRSNDTQRNDNNQSSEEERDEDDGN